LRDFDRILETKASSIEVKKLVSSICNFILGYNCYSWM